MMTDYIYAVLNGDGLVENAVIADNPDAAFMLRSLIPDAAEIVLATEATGPAYIGGDMHGGRFRMPRPYPSWVWDEARAEWVAPVAYPEGGNGYFWSEDTTSWVEIPAVVTDKESDDA